MDDREQPVGASEALDAINAITGDILKNTPRIYPKGHPVSNLPRVATEVERAIKLGRIDDARQRAGVAGKYLDVYSPSEEGARKAKNTLTRRFATLTGGN